MAKESVEVRICDVCKREVKCKDSIFGPGPFQHWLKLEVLHDPNRPNSTGIFDFCSTGCLKTYADDPVKITRGCPNI